MATLVFTAVGQALGGPFGAAIGSMLGQAVDAQIFGPGPRKGPRLGDLSVQTSSYGTPVPRLYGTMRAAGTVVWATDLIERESDEGGGKGSPGVLIYRYSVGMAVALSSRPIVGVGRIWADGKLIRGAEGDFKVRTTFRLLNGSEDQPVDALIASVETLALCPAYRGLALAVFEDFDLAEFGNRIPSLTFEIIADEGAVDVATVLGDVSRGVIAAAPGDAMIGGFAAHGRSRRGALDALVEVAGVELGERAERLETWSQDVVAVDAAELGCAAGEEAGPRGEWSQVQGRAKPSRLSISYYDPDRDYQAGVAQAWAGGDGDGEDQVELPAVLGAGEARQLAEAAMARSWAAGEQLTIGLPPRLAGMRAGARLALGDGGEWLAQQVDVEGLSVRAVCRRVGGARVIVPADAGRSAAQHDAVIGQSEIALFELPAADQGAVVYVAVANSGAWKSVPVEIFANGAPIANVLVTKRAVMGRSAGVLGAATSLIMDHRNSVEVVLADPAMELLSADEDALMMGANLALIGEELVQYGSAELLSPGRYRLSKLLRGRRGTEWAITDHAANTRFVRIDAAALRAVPVETALRGGTVRAIAHGISDNDPYPADERSYMLDALRPVAPCHVRAWISGGSLQVEWLARSVSAFGWPDGAQPNSGRFRVILSDGGASLPFETDGGQLVVDAGQLPPSPAQLTISIRALGEQAESRPATIIINI